MAAKLGILAGGGPLPGQLAEACHRDGRNVFILAFEGQTDPARIGEVEHAWVRLGAAGAAIKALKAAQVDQLVLAGSIRRPSLAELKPDLRATAILAKAGKKALGDDGMLGAIIGALEGEGFRITGLDEILSGLLAPPGLWGRVAPDKQAQADIERGLAVARALGSVDVGQGVVVQQGLVLGVEAIEGTDALLQRAGGLRREGPGGVLVKTCKPGQERRADLPTIGVQTVAAAARAGLQGIAVEAGGTLVPDRAGVVQAADSAGLFVTGVAAPE